MLVLVMVLVGIAGYEGITCARLSFLVSVFVSADVFLVPLPLFVLVLLVLCSLFVLWFPPSSDWYRTSGFLFLWAWSSFGRRLYIRVVYVRS
jgi:hypothetical protein